MFSVAKRVASVGVDLVDRLIKTSKQFGYVLQALFVQIDYVLWALERFRRLRN